ncbi:aminodeoxychorismate lyase [Pseudoalteromonas phenolica]|uniref:aminodeoxychorismate lyase n=1 Tax=Pseudoalteromonas phenolica TaxID=161398 RepID=UPI000FFE7A1E|nr:aminodeoxychorismate lyase [Pseudoalteromonas phenolica]RXF06119.1 aminodeoxychorismate lyase [Pseudoalteromonas phenolica O-BC30]
MSLKITTTITPQDRGFQYGDGFFTTAAIKSGKVQHLDLHFTRLQSCAKALYFPKIDWQQLQSECKKLVSEHKLAVLKVIITRGEGGRGYQAPDNPSLNAIVSILPFPTHYADWQAQGIKVSISNVKLGHQPLLAGLKTLNRLEQVLIKQDAKQFIDSHDVVVLDINNQVIETSAGNLIGFKHGELFTPKLSKAGIKGVYLSALQQVNTITEVEESTVFWTDMDALFTCNSLMELVPIIQLDSKKV